MHLTQHEAIEWTVIDEAITRLAADKGALDLDIGRWLLVAHREGVERRLGFGSFAEYVERRLGYDARTTFERLRVARALEVLPALAALLRRGQRSWSAVRELTRVATPDTEAAWVEASERMTVRQVEAMVAGRESGDLPHGARDPVITPRRLVFELAPDELAEWQEAAEHVRRELGPAATNREVLRALVQKELGQRPESQPGYQTAVTVCSGCERTWQRAGGDLVEVAPEVGECARCDGEVVGVVALEDPVGAESEHVGGWARSRPHESAHVGGASSAHVGSAVEPEPEPGVAEVLGRLARRSGIRVLTRVLSQVIGAPAAVTPKLRAAVRTRDRGRCVVPGCTHFRFLDLHHQVRRADGGANTLGNLLSLCTRHHRRVHEGVLSIEREPGGRLVVRHAGGVLYGAAGPRLT